jgi:eukaryotic-like serine/threonine-protein kinase
MIGQTVSHYRILEKLGGGGMGVVYKALDTHLDRPVAIKVLRPDVVADRERKLRFVQEAKTASALNHPNILHVYDIDDSEGIDFIAMEYVAGKTLEEVIGRKGLPLKDALKYAVQIADGLAQAHTVGIIHRDLKPANIMVTRGGVVKLLDFGLAKLTEKTESDERVATQSLKAQTEAGMIVGTVAYMSPEQAEGKKVDARSDIFSFGSVLYEMLTGQRAFQGQTNVSTLAAILHNDPPHIESAPTELERTIRRCLRKEPERRSQNIQDVKLALEELTEESESGRLAASASARQQIRVPTIIGLAGVLLAAGMAWVWWQGRSPQPMPAPTFTRLTSDSGLSTDPALSPDGKLVAYASDRSGEGNLDIYVQQVGGGEPIRLTRDPADDSEPAFSPDGTKIVFRSERQGGGIYVVSTLGGPARRVVVQAYRPQFSPDGDWIAYAARDLDCSSSGLGFSKRDTCRIYIVSSAGGVPRRLQPDFAAAAYPTWSPDGKHLLFLGNRDEKLPPEDNIDWWVTPFDSGPALKTGALAATRDAKLNGPFHTAPWALVAPAWSPDGNSVIFSARSADSTNLWRIGISPRTWKVTGPPERLTSGLTLEVNPSVVSGPGGATRVAFASLTENANIWSLPIDANRGRVTGELQQLTREAAVDFFPSLSPDGTKLVFVSTRSGSQEVWIKDLRSGEESALTATGTSKWLPLFSPDGSKVSFTCYENKDEYNGYIVPAKGGALELMCEECGQATAWLSDGKRIVGNTVHWRVWLLDLPSHHSRDLLHAGRSMSAHSLSPDERWILLFDGTSWVAPFRGGTPVDESTMIPVAKGDMRDWSPNGTLLYGFLDRDGFWCIWAQRLDATTKRPIGAPFAIFHAHSVRRSLLIPAYPTASVGRDRIVFSVVEHIGNIWMAEWKAQK